LQKEKKIEEIIAKEGRSEADVERDEENLVTIQELINAVTALQRTPDSSRLEQIAEVSYLLLKIENCIIQNYYFLMNNYNLNFFLN
jgi:hypothetical protein